MPFSKRAGSVYRVRIGNERFDRVQVVKGPPEVEYLRRHGIGEHLIELLFLSYDSKDVVERKLAKSRCYKTILKEYGKDAWERVRDQKDLYCRMRFWHSSAYQLALGWWFRLMCGEKDVPELTEEDVDGPLERGGSPRQVIRRLVIAARGRKATRVQNIEWVNEHILVPYKDIDVSSIPSASAVALLRYAKMDERKYRAQYDCRYESPAAPAVAPAEDGSDLPKKLLEKYGKDDSGEEDQVED